jgi:hypothetical protein
MNSKRRSYCQRPTMRGLRFIFRTLSLLRTIIMLFIRSAPNYDFVRRNHRRRTRLKRLFKLCYLLIRSYNTNTYFRLRSMMSLLLKIIINIMLELLLFLRFITMRRKKVLLRIQLQRKMIGLQGATAIGKKRMVPLVRGIICSVRHAELSSIQLRSVIHLSTLWPCTRNS